MSEAFSPALTNVLQALAPGRRPEGEGCFPPQCRGVDLRVGDREAPSVWFRRIVDHHLESDLQACTIERNLALFLKFGWRHGQFRYINCQALATIDGTLEDAYLAPDEANPRYLRLDYDDDPLLLGALFSHPVVHIHGQPDEAPRFAIESSGGSGTALIDFFDFLYRNFCHAAWCRWANAVWWREAPTPNVATYFEVIQGYFMEEDTSGKRNRLPEILNMCRQHFPAMKRAFRAAKDEMPLALPVDPDHRDLFTYHQG